jgi:hypothetical protein
VAARPADAADVWPLPGVRPAQPASASAIAAPVVVSKSARFIVNPFPFNEE